MAAEKRFDLTGKRVFVAGHGGLVGRALCRRLMSEEVSLLTASRQEVDLTRQDAVEDWVTRHQPDVIFCAAAKVGGILANNERPVDFIQDNLLIEVNLLKSAFECGVQKLLFLGSACAYPSGIVDPIKEEYLLNGLLELSSRPYAIAKIAGIELCRSYRRQYGCDFISVMPANLYGPNDNFDLATGHVIPALMRKMNLAISSGAEEVEILGRGGARREFLHVDDLADACLFLMEYYSEDDHINVGCGVDISISELSIKIQSITGFAGRLRFESKGPEGVQNRVLDIRRIAELGWQSKISLDVGLSKTYEWYCNQIQSAKK